ncbi:ABC transporter ATP-binding protein [Paenibacillus marinisediminis]
MSAVVNLDRISKVYKGKHAVHDVSLDIHGGSITAILGPNGAGKTTTISMMLGLVKCTQGKVRIFGKEPTDIAVREQIGAMLQTVKVLDGLKVEEIIDLFRSYYPNPMSKAELFQISGLEQERKKLTGRLSGGQRRRLGFALAMAGNPKLLFLDEPTVGMDVVSRRLFWDTIKALAAKGTTIIFTSHDLREVEDLADRIVMLHRGTIIADGSPDEVKAQLTTASVSFAANHEESTINRIKMLPEVLEVKVNEERIVIQTNDSDSVVYALFSMGIRMKSLQIEQGRLDDAFVELTKSQEEAAV